MAGRTTHRSRSGSKLYAKRGKDGQFEDIQSYKRAHGSDVKRVSKAEASKKRAAKPASSGKRAGGSAKRSGSKG